MENRNVLVFEHNDRTKISDNFRAYEFDCEGSGEAYCPYTFISMDTVAILEILRAYLNFYFYIEKGESVYGKPSSGFRGIIHNKNVGGSAQSWHLTGKAVDIQYFTNKNELINPDIVSDVCDILPKYYDTIKSQYDSDYFEGTQKQLAKKFIIMCDEYNFLQYYFNGQFVGGLGRYNSFTHIDTRFDGIARWDYRS